MKRILRKLTVSVCMMGIFGALGAEAADKASEGISNLLGTKLVNASNGEVSVNALAGKKVGIYFSAHWCPPCRQFTPRLVQAYNGMVGDGKDFGMVFVSSDRNPQAMQKYMKEAKMPWPAIPYSSSLRKSLGQKYGVRGIPTLVIVDENGKLISKNARGDIASLGAKAYDKW